MIEINVRAWADWDKMMEYIKEMQKEGFKIKLINISNLFEIWHGEELEQLGFKLRKSN